jgi:hypothetical protein
MKNDKLSNLARKTAIIFSASLTALLGVSNKPLDANNNLSEGKQNIKSEKARVKPMPILKINFNNPSNSQFVAMHQSHRSHSSHYSHYSHRSGAMFA